MGESNLILQNMRGSCAKVGNTFTSSALPAGHAGGRQAKKSRCLRMLRGRRQAAEADPRGATSSHQEYSGDQYRAWAAGDGRPLGRARTRA